MKERLTAFADRYAGRRDGASPGEDERRHLRHPLVFLAVGDRSKTALERLFEMNRAQWTHADGILYIYIGTGTPDGVPGSQLLCWQPPSADAQDKRTSRSELSRAMIGSAEKLQELNLVLRQLVGRIGERGRLYGSLMQVHAAVLTRAEDPANALLPEVMVLLRSVLGESFRSVSADLFTLLREKQSESGYALDAALSVAFLDELDRMQRRSFRYEADLQVTSDGLRLPSAYGPGPLFDTAYMLGDKDERGLFAEDDTLACARIICRLSFLRCRQTADGENRLHPYNHQLFRQSMMPPGAAEAYYASAGLAEVTRPDRAVALTVLLALHRRLLALLQENGSGMSGREVLETLGLEAGQTDSLAQAAMDRLPDPVEEMHGLLYEPLSPAALRGKTLRQAENALFGSNARDFFGRQSQRLKESLSAGAPADRLRQAIWQRLVEDSRYGVYAVCRWTSPDERHGLIGAVREWRLENDRRLAAGREELEAVYEESADGLPGSRGGLFGLFGGAKAGLKTTVGALLDRVYGLKRELLFLELKRELLLRYEHMLEELHGLLKRYVDRLEQLTGRLAEACRLSIREANDEMGRNVEEYYKQAVDRISAELESRWGERFEFDERRMGSLAGLLEQGDDAYIARLMQTAQNDWFAHPLFSQAFEQELLERANVTVSYDNRQVLTKEELYRDLCRALDKESAVRADVYRFTHRHRHEESYLFGDPDSELIRYAMDAGELGESKLGCVHVSKGGGVELLRLMGGFRRDDLMIYRNGRRFYETYAESGYRFHKPDWEPAAPEAAAAGQPEGAAEHEHGERRGD
ncbi:hypothetical protein SAMN02799630_03810 [Paenibacillus sp. UNCCL117]|uniref:hypothetical protein n=1 Tax=unclassified Paenibacillus TaxID=185978 RepID=UPI00088D1B9F|nr:MULTISPECIES: hypothetical protein [unclassified Paenibacillus]SDD59216.1 hypothetical protein SAMN04488602_110127 [Paenibacillus sp. cl123]SFW50860.1 hypothetical protein SAMN02799630_03810 [Paenibacillus sp. UNCCL117]